MSIDNIQERINTAYGFFIIFMAASVIVLFVLYLEMANDFNSKIYPVRHDVVDNKLKIEEIYKGHWECIEQNTEQYITATFTYSDHLGVLGNKSFKSKVNQNANSSIKSMANFKIPIYFSDQTTTYDSYISNIAITETENKTICTKKAWVMNG